MWVNKLKKIVLILLTPFLLFTLLYSSLFSVILVTGAAFVLNDEEEVQEKYCKVKKDFDLDLAKELLDGVPKFEGLESSFVNIANEKGIDGVLLVAVALVETDYGTSSLFKRKNNINGEKQRDDDGRRKYVRFSTVESGISALANDLLDYTIYQKKYKVDKLAELYSSITLTDLSEKEWKKEVNKIIKQLDGLTLDCSKSNFDASPPLSMGGDFVIPTNIFVVTSPFGYRTHPTTGEINSFHSGIDLDCYDNDPIVSAVDGTVIYSEDKGIYGGWSTTYGNYVIVNHGSFNTQYAHLAGTYVNVGDTVKAGDPIGACGTTGRSSGSHLHFEVRIGGNYVDPYPYLVGSKK